MRCLKLPFVVVVAFIAISAPCSDLHGSSLLPPSGYEVSNLFQGMNNKGQVLGEAGNLQKSIRFPGQRMSTLGMALQALAMHINWS